MQDSMAVLPGTLLLGRGDGVGKCEFCEDVWTRWKGGGVDKWAYASDQPGSKVISSCLDRSTAL